eukprot:Ihof_evm18s17 gene=Ihof_evmTU18s17
MNITSSPSIIRMEPKKRKLSAADKQRVYRVRKQERIESTRKELDELRSRTSRLELENEQLRRGQEHLKQQLEQTQQQAQVAMSWQVFAPVQPIGTEPFLGLSSTSNVRHVSPPWSTASGPVLPNPNRSEPPSQHYSKTNEPFCMPSSILSNNF